MILNEAEREKRRSHYQEPRPSDGLGDGVLFLRSIYLGLDEHPSVTDFHLHSKAEQEADQREADEMKKKFRGSGHDEADVLEAMLNVEIDRSEWFGALTSRTTFYDDLKGTDAVLEWDEKERFGFVPRLLVDVTSSSQQEKIDEKLKKLDEGRDVKYVRSQVDVDRHGQGNEMALKKIPIVILGIDKNLVEGLGQYAITFSQERNGKQSMDRKAFAEHPLKILLLEQALIQVDRQIRQEVARLAQELINVKDIPELNEVIETYNKLMKETEPPTVDQIIEAFEPVQNKIRQLYKIESIVSILNRWRNLRAIYILLLEKREENEKTASTRLTDQWRSSSETHRLLTREAA